MVSFERSRGDLSVGPSVLESRNSRTSSKLALKIKYLGENDPTRTFAKSEPPFKFANVDVDVVTDIDIDINIDIDIGIGSGIDIDIDNDKDIDIDTEFFVAA